MYSVPGHPALLTVAPITAIGRFTTAQHAAAHTTATMPGTHPEARRAGSSIRAANADRYPPAGSSNLRQSRQLIESPTGGLTGISFHARVRKKSTAPCCIRTVKSHTLQQADLPLDDLPHSLPEVKEKGLPGQNKRTKADWLARPGLAWPAERCFPASDIDELVVCRCRESAPLSATVIHYFCNLPKCNSW